MSIWWCDYPIVEVFISNALCIKIKCNNLFWCKELEKSSLKVVVIRVKTKMCAFIMVYSGLTLQVCWQLSDMTHFWRFTITVFLLHYFNVQIEWLTAGDCIAGMHEVVVTERTIDAIKLATQQNRSLWRVSSTVSESNPYIQHHPRPYSWTWYLQSEHIVKAPLCFICLSLSYPAVCTHCIWCCTEAFRPFCGIPTCSKISIHVCRRICWTRACDNQSKRKQSRALIIVIWKIFCTFSWLFWWNDLP